MRYWSLEHANDELTEH